MKVTAIKSMAVTCPPDKSTFNNALQEIGKPRATDTDLQTTPARTALDWTARPHVHIQTQTLLPTSPMH